MLNRNAFDQLSSLERNSIQNHCQSASTLNGLPSLIANAMADENSCINFITQYPSFAQVVPVSIWVDQILKINSPRLAIHFVSNNTFRNKLNKDATLVSKLFAHENFQKHLEWVQCLSYHYSRKDHANPLMGELAFAKSAFLGEKNVSDIDNSLVNNFFSAINPYNKENIQHFLKHTYKYNRTAKFLNANQVREMFEFVQGEQILELSEKLISSRPDLLENYIKEQATHFNSKIVRYFTSAADNKIADFLNRHRKIVGILFPNDSTNENNNQHTSLENQLQHIPNPRILLTTHKDTISSDQLSAIKSSTTESEIETILSSANNATEFSKRFHLIVAHKKPLLIKLLNKTDISKDIQKYLVPDLSKKFEETRNEWLAMHLKENADLFTALCGKNPQRVVSLLKLTADPVSFIYDLISNLEYADRPLVLFKAVVEVAKFSTQYPTYKNQLDRLLNMHCLVSRTQWSACKETIIGFLSQQIYYVEKEKTSKLSIPLSTLEEDIQICLEHPYLESTFKLMDNQLTTLTRELSQPRSHQLLARKLKMEYKTSDDIQKLSGKSPYYTLKLLELLDQETQDALFSILLYGSKAQDNNAKKIIDKVGIDKFHVENIWPNLSYEDQVDFVEYAKKQFLAIQDSPTELLNILTRFKAIPAITTPLLSLISNSIGDLTKKSIYESGLALFNYAKNPETQHLIFGQAFIPGDLLRRIMHAAVEQQDWNFVHTHSAQFLQSIPTRNEIDYGIFEALFLKNNIMAGLRGIFNFRDLLPLQYYTAISSQIFTLVPLDRELDDIEQTIVLGWIKEPQFQVDHQSFLVSLLQANTKQPAFIRAIMLTLKDETKLPMVVEAFLNQQDDTLISSFILDEHNQVSSSVAYSSKCQLNPIYIYF